MKGKISRLLQLALRQVKKHPLLVMVGCVAAIGFGSFAMEKVEAYPAVACAPCHGMESYVDNYKDSELLSHKHQQADVKCIDCHEQGMEEKIGELQQYVTDDFDDPPQKRKFPNEMCLKCHDVNDIKTKTVYEGGKANPHDSHLGDLTCSDCHKMHSKSQTTCSDCHSFAFTKQLPSEWTR